MKNRVIKFGIYTFAILALFLSQYNAIFAATLKSLIENVTGDLATSVVTLIFSLAFVYFFWGVVQYVLYPDDGEKKEKGKQFIIWGLIGLTVMFTVYSLIKVIINTLLL